MERFRPSSLVATRRALLIGAMTLPFLGQSLRGSTLTKTADEADMLFGCAVRADQLFADRDFRALVTSECGEITPELELKWAFVEPDAGKYNFSSADVLAAFASENGKALHGHTLLWHDSIPPWAAAQLAQQSDWTIISRFIAETVTRYRDKISTWDVVNEPILIGQRDDGLRASPFLEAFGSGYVAHALKEVRKLAPKAKLFINEFGLLYDLPQDRLKREALLQLLETLKKWGVPLSGIGIQGHLELQHQSNFNQQVFADFLNRLGGLGLEIRISELDVKENRTELPADIRDQRAGEAVKALLDVAVENKAVGTITSWGLSDRYSWLPGAGETAGYNRGLPFNTDLKIKPIYAAIQQALAKRARQKP